MTDKQAREAIEDIAEIVAEIWLSGKNDSQVFDYHECSKRQKWVARLYALCGYRLAPEQADKREAVRETIRHFYLPKVGDTQIDAWLGEYQDSESKQSLWGFIINKYREFAQASLAPGAKEVGK